MAGRSCCPTGELVTAAAHDHGLPRGVFHFRRGAGICLQLLAYRRPGPRRSAIKGLIVSDDMEMGGILNYLTNAEATVLSLDTRECTWWRFAVTLPWYLAAYERILREAEGFAGVRPFVAKHVASRVRKVTAALPQRLPPAPTTTAVRTHAELP